MGLHDLYQGIQLRAAVLTRDDESEVTAGRTTGIAYEGWINLAPQELAPQSRTLPRAPRKNRDDRALGFFRCHTRIPQRVSHVPRVCHQFLVQAPICFQYSEALERRISQRKRHGRAACENLTAVEDFFPQVEGPENGPA